VWRLVLVALAEGAQAGTAQGLGPSPQWLYLVRFSGAELWGADGDPALDVSIDAWESYLEGAVA
jgi:nitrile hydratase